MSKKVFLESIESSKARPGACKASPRLEKLLAMWRGRNAQAARRVSTFSLMAAALSACKDSDSSNPAPAEKATAFSLDLSDDVATVVGEFAFLTDKVSEPSAVPLNIASQDVSSASVDAGPKSLVPATIDLGTESDGLLDVEGDFRIISNETGNLEGASALTLTEQVTVVGEFAMFDLNQDGVEVTGDGNVWLLIGEEGAPSKDYTARLDIRLEGGDLTFDMPSDENELTLEDGSVIDLGGGTLIVSDGRVLANAAEVEFLNIGDVVVNSELVITYEQFDEKLNDPDFTVTGTGTLTVLVSDDAQAQALFDKVEEKITPLGEDAPKVIVENEALGVVTEVDVASVVDSKVAFLSATIDKQLATLEEQLQSQVDGNAVDIAEVATGLNSLQATVSSLQEIVSSNENGLATLQDRLDGIDVKLTEYIATQIEALASSLQG